MTRLAWCILAVALAAGHCLAAPTTIERAMHRFEEMGVYQDSDNQEETSTTTTTAAPSQQAPEQWLSNLLKAVQKQLQLQENILRQLMKEIQDYLRDVFHTSSWEDRQINALDRVHGLLEKIGNRLARTIENVAGLIGNSDQMGVDLLRGAVMKFMKEVRLQDVVLDSLWASLRAVQTNAWTSGIAAIERAEPPPAADRAAEEFMDRMQQNLRAAGMSEEDMKKYVPDMDQAERLQARNMGRKGWGGWGYGYGYGYGYPRYYGYGYGYPSYYSYSYYPYSYGYGYGYPRYYSYPYYGHYYYRRLRPTGPTSPVAHPTPMSPAPPTPPMPGMTPSNPMMPTAPMVPSFRSMLEETMPLPTGAMPTGGMPTGGMPTGAMTGLRYNSMDYPMEGMSDPTESMSMNALPPHFDNSLFPNNSYTRNLAPLSVIAGIAPEPPMGPTPFGFGPPGLPF